MCAGALKTGKVAPGVVGSAPGPDGDWTENGGRGRVLTCGELGGLYVYGVDLGGNRLADDTAILCANSREVYRCSDDEERTERPSPSPTDEKSTAEPLTGINSTGMV